MAAKKHDTDSPNTTPDPIAALADEVRRLREQSEAQAKQTDAAMEMLAERDEQIAELLARPSATDAAPASSGIEAELNAELEDLKAEFRDYPQIDVFEQRVITGQEASADIRLIEDRSVLDDPANTHAYWKLRWFNLGKPNREEQAKAEGYVKVQWDDLQARGMVPLGVNMDPYVRRGDRGLEMLFKMPRKLHDYKMRRDAARRNGQLSSVDWVRDYNANQVAKRAAGVGDNADHAGSFAHGLTVSVTPQAKETVTL